MRKIVAILLFLACSEPAARAQQQYSFLLHKSYSERFMQIDSMFYDASHFNDSADFFKAVSKLGTVAIEQNDDELYLEAQFIRYRFYPYSPIKNDYPGLELKLQELIEKAAGKKSRQLEIRARHNLGLYYDNKVNNYGAAIEQFLDAYYLMKNVSTRELPDKRDYVYSDISRIYYSMGDFENAKKFLLESDTLPIYAVPRFRKMRAVINSTNTLGMIYRSTADYDSAEYYFRKAYNIAVKEADSAWIGIAGGNIGITYFLQKRFNEAIPLLENDIRLSIRSNEYHNAANSLIKLAEISLFQHNYDKAGQQLLQARSLTAITYDQYRLLENLLPLMAKFHFSQGDISLAYLYLDSAIAAKDSAFANKSAVVLARAQQKTDVEHHKLEVEQLENQKNMQTLQRNGLLCIAILMVILSILLISQQRLLKKQKRAAEEQRQQAVTELGHAQLQLNSFTSNIRDKNELIERLTNEMNGLQKSLDKEQIDYRYQTLEQLRQSTILTDQEWDVFKNAFEKAYPAWFSRLQYKLPGLSAADLRFMALSKLKFNAKEMAAVLGISPNSIRMSRHRLRKKYNLVEEESLEQLTDSI